ncbi:MAG TPA: hypothetical protein VFA96_01465, partial [Nocardioides sp.]|nr:hypothetical protein [Nocardioides sp.]
MCDVHTRFIDYLEQQGILDCGRKLEHLPTDTELAERGAAGQGLVAPELAVLLAYTKLVAYNAILGSDIPDSPYLARELFAYFPTPIRERFPQQITHHPLRPEIVATRVANNTVNRAGTSWLFRMVEETGESVCELV